MNAPDRAGGLNGSAPGPMVDVWRRIFAALSEACVAMENSQALHSRDYSPGAFAEARVQMQKDYNALTSMRMRALGVFIVWDALPKIA